MLQTAVVREPLKLKPILQSKIWGGDGLYRVLKKGSDIQKDIGEAWELSDREEAATLIASGAFSGLNFSELFSQHAQDILGQQYSPTLTHFPLLYKFIYAREHLSVQVHPGEGSPLGEAKTECWYILEAPIGAELILGMHGEHGREKMLKVLASSECQRVLNRIPAKAGDLFFIPAGTVHAITAGLLLYEVQQNSDTTFRLYDWDRVDASGKSRDLHIQESSQVLDLRQHNQHQIEPLMVRHPTHDEEFRVACHYFAMIKYLRFTGTVELCIPNRFRVLTCIQGQLELEWEGGNSLILELGETLLIPAACPRVYIRDLKANSNQNSELLVSFIPELEEEIFSPLRAGGFSETQIQNLGGLEGLKKTK